MGAVSAVPVWKSLALASLIVVSSCSGGGGGDGAPSPTTGGSPPPPPAPLPPPPPPPPPPASDAHIFATEAATSRFLNQSTFGATPDDIASLTGTSASDWLTAQFNQSPSLNLEYTLAVLADPANDNGDGGFLYAYLQAPTYSFWINAIEGDDQLRQRMAFALSQILVVSHSEGNNIFGNPEMMAYYQDILVTNAFGNYRDLLGDVTYSPAMAEYLTYLENQKGDSATGRMPDENYAREIMQLFTIGLFELNRDGSLRTDAGGNPIPTYDNEDVQGLARVFTGLHIANHRWGYGLYMAPRDQLHAPLGIYPEHHSELEKTFLGTTIPAGTDAATSIDLALDTLFEHDNLPPFLARQLIQRFVTSDPEPAYIERVAIAFETGSYTLPNGESIGTGQRGDLQATISAVLMDDAARSEAARSAVDFGKIREPVIRFVHWARAFDVGTVTPQHTFALWNTGRPEALGQAPYKSASVFNFYRPGYIAPGTETGAAGMTVPELQIVNAGTVTSYANFMAYFIFNYANRYASEPEASSFYTDYTGQRDLALDPAALVDELDILLANGALAPETRANIIEAVAAIPEVHPYDPDYDALGARIQLAVFMVMTSPEYLVLR